MKIIETKLKEISSKDGPQNVGKITTYRVTMLLADQEPQEGKEPEEFVKFQILAEHMEFQPFEKFLATTLLHAQRPLKASYDEIEARLDNRR